MRDPGPGGDEQSVVRDSVRFERLVTELSASFVNLEEYRIDEAISDAQRRICDALDLDLSILFVREGEDLVRTHNWSRLDEPTYPIVNSIQLHSTWSLPQVLEGRVVAFSSPDEIPDEVERQAALQFGTKSRISLPLSVGGQVAGVISFGSVRRSMQWPEAIVGRLELIAQVFAGALARRRAELALRASEERFRNFADAAPVYMWVTDTNRSVTWLNRQWLEFIGSKLEDEVKDGWVKNVHPDDIEFVIHSFAIAFDARQPFSLDFRCRRHDGVWRWLSARGAAIYDSSGVFEGYVGSCLDITEEREAKVQLENTLREVQRLRDQLQHENVYLRREVHERYGSGPIVGRSPAVRRVLDQVEQVAPTDSTALLIGETGTGKELFATQIHERSARRSRTMVRVNCAAIPSTLIESELFGREKGAFTGALTRQIGRFELADHSTIFLDEIGDLPSEVQVKLLRVLEERQVERLGNPKSIHVDTRIIAATHRDLEQLILDGRFRADLFYRLNVFPIRVPPLRERNEDIPLLVSRFVEEFSKSFGKTIEVVSKENLAALQRYSWPGNIRELRNVVERAVIAANGPRLTIELPAPLQTPTRRVNVKLDELQKQHIRAVLETSGWRVRGSGGAADRLGLKPTTLESRMAKLGLRRPKQM
jgi:formate hydrogenlyase transcriptional activator